jgi:hypothetical protein
MYLDRDGPDVVDEEEEEHEEGGVHRHVVHDLTHRKLVGTQH